MIIDLIERLRAHVAGAQGIPVIAKDDCGPWVASWIEQETQKRVNFPVYRTKEEAYALAEQAGGLVNLIVPLMASIPLWETKSPLAGDVGVVRLSDRDTCGIFCGNDFIAIRGENRGVFYLRPKTILKAWSLSR